MWENIKNIIKRLFNKITNKTDEEANEHKNDTRAYEDFSYINIGNIVANKLATMTVAESAPNIEGLNERAEKVNEILQRAWGDAQEVTARAFGIGGVALVPYIVGGKIYTDIVPKDRFFITRSQGTDIVGATLIADIIVRNNKKYMRLTDYELEGNTYVIRNRAVREDSPCSLDELPEWAGMPEELRIQNCDRLLLAYLRNPYAKGRTDNLYGVPITRGSEKIIEEITECLEQIKTEYKNKKSKIFADQTLFDANDRLDATLYKTTMGGGSLEKSAMFEIFDPVIRDSAYYNRLENLFALLEKSIGTSRGILTEPKTLGATATEIKRSSYDTYALISAMRKQWEKAVDDLVYAYSVLSNAYNLSVTGEVKVSWDWSDSLIESSVESWNQLKDGKAQGVISKTELRQYLMPHETLEESEKAVSEISKNEPTVAQLFGDE